jgi:4-methylaminobutanoate oxidase (formaldehyde-forming)
VGLFDQTSFAKFLLQGRDAEAVLQRICANDVRVLPGRVVYTMMLNNRGGIEADLTVTRLAEDAYMIVSGGGGESRDFHWISGSIQDGSQAFLTNVTSAYAVLGLMGPNSRELLSGLTSTDLSNEVFPFLSSREIGIGFATVRATRITYVGELGWELYVPADLSTGVYDALVNEGEKHGLRHAGFHAMESLRTEKGYRAWGMDITDQETPVQAGPSFAVALDKPVGFAGKAALLRQLEDGVTQRLALFTLEDPEPLLLGDEPIYRDGKLAGRTTSGTFGHTVGRAVGMGYVENEEGVDGAYIRSGNYEIEIGTERFPATTSLRPPYDPKNERVRL